MNTTQLQTAQNNSELFRQAVKTLGWFSLSKQDQAAAINSRLREIGMKAARTEEKKKIAEKFEKKGIAIGKNEGIIEGSRQKAIEVARKMLAVGIDTKVVIECTGLTYEDINSIAVKS